MRRIVPLLLGAALLGCSDKEPGAEREDVSIEQDAGGEVGIDAPPEAPTERGGFSIGGQAVESASYRARILLTVPVRQVSGESPAYRVEPEPISPSEQGEGQ